MSHSSDEEITALLAALTPSNPDATAELMAAVYQDLHLMAARLFQRERPGHSLQPTLLADEAFLRLTDTKTIQWQSRGHFFAVASRVMRRVLLDHARARRAEKRGGRRERVELEVDLVFSTEPSTDDLLIVDEALKRLEAFAPRQARIVELRFFAGLSLGETAETLGMSITTVKEEWRLARAWLRRELED